MTEEKGWMVLNGSIIEDEGGLMRKEHFKGFLEGIKKKDGSKLRARTRERRVGITMRLQRLQWRR